jgi:hypothetical protein
MPKNLDGSQCEYGQVDLNALPRKASEIDVLNDAGEDGWQLVVITRKSVADLKRQVGTANSQVPRR